MLFSATRTCRYLLTLKWTKAKTFCYSYWRLNWYHYCTIEFHYCTIKFHENCRKQRGNNPHRRGSLDFEPFNRLDKPQLWELKLLNKSRDFDNKRIVVVKTRNPCKVFEHGDISFKTTKLFCSMFWSCSVIYLVVCFFNLRLNMHLLFFHSKLGRRASVVGRDSGRSCCTW